MASLLCYKSHVNSPNGQTRVYVLATCARQASKIYLGRRHRMTGHPRQRAVVYSTNGDLEDDSRGTTLSYDLRLTRGTPHVKIARQKHKFTGTPSGEIDSKSRTEASNAERQVSTFVRNTATTFAPRASTATRNPAFKGSVLYTVFGAQAWISVMVGGLLSFNVIFPSDKPSIARLIGMWSIWMFTIPALRARECTADEKEVLNLLFVLIPLLNVALPFIWKSFSFIFTADCAALAAIYYWKIGWPDRQT